MRLNHSLLISVLSCLSSAAAAASDAAHVYIREAQGQRRDISHERRTLSPAAARVVLAQRAGVEEYHSADMLDAHALQAINDFGSASSLFGSDSDRRQAIVLLHTDQDLSSSFPSSDELSHFHISPLPSLESTRSLLLDIAQQAGLSTPVAGSDSTMSNDKLSITTTLSRQALRPEDYPDYDLIIITLPTTTTSTTSASPNHWGTYSMPNPHSYLKAKRDQSPTTTRLGALASSSTPLKGIFPTCFPSLQTCQNLTRHCTGHGSCSLKYTDPSAADNAFSKHCYACACTPQKRTGSDGKEITTYWGGPACQKKDVSVEFWMIALFSVAMVGLISFAVGSVWSMGDEELPSVIGAGVSGPVARR